MWKSRFDLPVLQRLPHLNVDIQALKAAYAEYERAAGVWDGLGNEYSALCETHTRLPKMFFREDELEGVNHVCDLNWKEASYQQLALTEFDSTYKLDDRTELSGSAWDRRVAKGREDADERWFRKKVDGLPAEIAEIIDRVGGGKAHRTRFAKLAPHSRVKPHIDYDTLYGVRLHIVVATNPLCRNGGTDRDGNVVEEHFPDDGSVWFVNPGVKHWAVNDGDTERVHLIISIDSQEVLGL